MTTAMYVEEALPVGSTPPTNESFLMLSGLPTTPETLVRAHDADMYNSTVMEAAASLPWNHPTGKVQWVLIDRIQCNEYNPNSVAGHEMKLLHTSISEDGYTMPVVTIWDPDAGTFEPLGRFVIVDGFHRYSVMLRYQDIYDESGGYLPVVLIDKPVADRIASTVRHNRARGKHSVAGMSNLVFEMLKEGVTDAEICNKIGLEAEELARLKHITGYSKLYKDHQFSAVRQTESQLMVKAQYKKENPDVTVPRW